MTPQEMHEKLENLKSKKDTQELFTDLNFDYSDNDGLIISDDLIFDIFDEILNKYK